jgi:hypothetical protein
MRVSIHLLLILFLLAACSLKKRNYRHGYYVDWAFYPDKKKENRNRSLKKDNTSLTQKNMQLILPEQEVVLSAAAEKSLSPGELKKNEASGERKDGECDTLFFRDGKVIAVKVFEILPYEIKYKRCDYSEGPMTTVNKNDVAKVVYANGISETFEIKHKIIENEYSSSSKKQDAPQEVKNHESAYVMLGITLSIFFLGVLSSIAGLIYAPIALRRIRETKGKFKGEEIVRICRIVCLVATILSLIFLALFLFILMTVI